MAKSKLPKSAERRSEKPSPVDEIMAAVAGLSESDREELLDRIEYEYPGFDPSGIPEWHKELLKQRLADLRKNPDAGIPLSEYLKKLGNA